MSADALCLFCGSRIPRIDRSGTLAATCPGCGAAVSDNGLESNPYAAPLTTFDQDEVLDVEREVTRTSVLEKLSEALRLFGSNFLLISLISLTIWLPANFLISAIVYSSDDQVTRGAITNLSQFIEGILGPICVGALIHLLERRKSGKRTTYGEALGVGFRNWGRLFGTRLATGIIIMLGMIALIVPGIIFAFRYALIDPIVILEGQTGQAARRRSQQLTDGYKFQIFGAGILFFCLFALFGAITEELMANAEPLNNVITATIVACTLNIVSMFLPIVMFLIHRESAHLQGVRDAEPVHFLDE